MNQSESATRKPSQTFVLILRDLTNSELQELQSIFASDEIDVQWTNSPQTQHGTQVQLINRDKIYQDSYEDAFDDILSFGELELTNGKKLADHLKGEDGFSWWYYFRFMVLYKYRSKLYDQRMVEQIGRLKYQNILVYHHSGFLDKRLNGIAKSMKGKSKESSNALGNALIFLFTFWFRSLIGVFQIGKLLKKSRSIFIASAQPNQKIIESKSLNEIQGDHFAEYYRDKVANDNEFLILSEFFPPNLKSGESLKIKKEILFSRHKNTLNLEFILYLQLFNPWFYARCIRYTKSVKKSFSDLESSELKMENEFLLEILPSFKRLSYFLAIRKAALTWLFKVKKISSIGGTNEHDPRVKSILEVAKTANSTTYGIQHGVIHPRHMHYCFTQEDAARGAIPDMTFMWGKHWADYLTEFSSYTSDQLRIVGQIRSDIIPTLNKVPKQDLVKELDSNKPTIMYPSQPLYTGEQEMRKRLATDFLQLTKDFPDLQFVIKPHPKELDCEDFMGRIADSIDTNNYVIVKGDLYKTIASSDLVIVYNSTVGAEAVYFSKPLFVMDYSNNDFSGFIQSGIGTEILNYTALKESVQNFKNGTLSLDRESVEEFIAQRAYKIDGKVCDRIISELKA